MTPETLRSIMPYALAVFVGPLTDAMEEFEINTPLRQAMFLANLAHESGEFRYMEELADGKAYEDREDLGNNLTEAKVWPPDGKAGPWFKGHGPIQITGYFNHRKYSALLFGDEKILLSDPRRLCTPVDGCRSAAAFFKEERCNDAADANNFLLCCQIINMAPRHHGTQVLPNGWDHRRMYFSRCRAVML